jgi:uridine kinase
MTVEITLPSGEKRRIPAGSRIEEAVHPRDFPASEYPLVAVLVNNDIASLTYRLEVNCTLKPVFLNSREGAAIYRRSLCYLLTKASKQLFPDRRLVVGHSLGNGYYYYFDGLKKIEPGDLQSLSERMQEIVHSDMPIRRSVISYLEALEFFKTRNQPDTQLLLEHRNDPKIPIYECGDFADLAHAVLVPNTGVLKVFELMDYPPGFLLRYPPWDCPQKLAPFQDSPALFSIYSEYKNWGKILDVYCVGRLNTLIHRGEVKQFIAVAEALHDKKIAEIADRIHALKDRVWLILIAGPSSSGKTTFSKKLSIQLQVLGRNPMAISLDDYFQPRELTPRDEQGNYDFEALEALDIELLNRHLLALFEGEEVLVPEFDFHTGRRKSEVRKLKLPPRAVLILEGIHALNDRLTPRVAADRKYKIYVSALTQLNLDDHNRISTTDNRLLRRIVRDYQFRDHSALETLSMWQSVRNGEEKHIFPFQNSADTLFNSALDYELAVLKVFAEPQLITVKPDTLFYHEARRLLSFLNGFVPIHPGRVPQHSILREFIGESGFKY